MTKTVYILGAGANQSVEAWGGLKPPMAENFFQLALQSNEFAAVHDTGRIQPVFDFIANNFNRSELQLKNEPFDLEKLFTVLDLRQDDMREHDQERFIELWRISFLLKSFFAEFLNSFETHAAGDLVTRALGRIIQSDHASVLTFNYDCILECGLESAAGVRSGPYPHPHQRPELTDAGLAYSHYYWNRPLGYGFKFSEIELQQAGPRRYVDGERFYGIPSNALYDTPVLKLHGSLNWFRFLPIRRFPDLPGDSPLVLPESRRDAIVLLRGHWWLSEPPDLDGWFMDPILVTPVLNKQPLLADPPFPRIWEDARKKLADCQRLIVVGYSFPPTDFHAEDLLRRAYQSGPPEEVILVNPDQDGRVAKTILELTRASALTASFSSVEDYVRSIGGADDPTIPGHSINPYEPLPSTD